MIAEFHAKHGKGIGGFGDRLLLLTTKGAKSGRAQLVPVAYHRDGDRYVIVASKSGAPTNPDWYHNLKAHPNTRIEVGSETIDVIAEEATGEEHDRLFARAAKRYPQLVDLARRTDRVIPMIVLTPRGNA